MCYEVDMSIDIYTKYDISIPSWTLAGVWHGYIGSGSCEEAAPTTAIAMKVQHFLNFIKETVVDGDFCME